MAHGPLIERQILIKSMVLSLSRKIWDLLCLSGAGSLYNYHLRDHVGNVMEIASTIM